MGPKKGPDTFSAFFRTEVSFRTTALSDRGDRRAIHPAWFLELPRVANRRDVVELALHLLLGIAHISELFSDRCPRVGVRAAFQEQPGLRIVARRQRDDRVEQRRVSAETL